MKGVFSEDVTIQLIKKQEKEAIVDTATTLAKSPRTPTLTTFMPIGHIALDLYPERNTQFSLPQSTVWIKSLYISRYVPTLKPQHPVIKISFFLLQNNAIRRFRPLGNVPNRASGHLPASQRHDHGTRHFDKGVSDNAAISGLSL